jgi:hypothetical protein
VEDDKHHRHEAAAHAMPLAAKVLGNVRGGQDSAVRVKVFATPASASVPSLPPLPTSYAGAVLSTLGGNLLPAVPPTPPSPTTGSQPQAVYQCVRPCRRTGHRNLPRTPSLINAALPSHPQPTCGGTSPPISAVLTLLARDLARANSPPCSEMPSPLLTMTASSSPSLQPFGVKKAVSMLLDGGGAHPFHDRGLPLPPRKRACGRRHPRCVCRRHGPRAPNPLEPLLCGQRHRPRVPNASGGWA